MARPKKSLKDYRHPSVWVYLSDQEKNLFNELCRINGLEGSAYVRALVYQDAQLKFKDKFPYSS